MIEGIFGHDEEVGVWASRMLGRPLVPPFAAIGFAKDGQLAGAVVFNGWNGANLDITIYGPGCLCRSAIRTSYRYAFVQCKALRLTARTHRSNELMQKLLPRLGFKLESVMPKYYGPGKSNDAFCYRLTAFHAQRWM